MTEGRPAAARRPPRQHMAEQPAAQRARNFEEVPHGYTAEQALAEATRCLMCKKPSCMAGCPVGVKIPEFIGLIKQGRFIEADAKLKEDNYLPAICGRVCPQEEQCEKLCVLAKKGESVAVGNLERFAADYARSHVAHIAEVNAPQPSTPEPGANRKRVAIIGSGPAGLTAAGDLVKRGYDVTIFEALHKPGGVLVYGIPEFRLPKKIVQEEVDYLKSLGVRVEMNKIAGKLFTIEELLQGGYDAVFIGVGAGAPQFLGIPGENLSGVYSANEYLTRSNLMRAYLFPRYGTPIVKSRKTIVVGAGNVAMDAARTALRLGSEVTLVYRRSRAEMPARKEETRHAEEEGIKFQLLTNPVEILGDDDGRVRAVRCLRMELGEPDASGRRRPVPVKGSEFEIEADAVIVAVGTQANPLLTRSTAGLALNKWGNIEVNPETMQTSLPRVYAGGDIVTGSATVIEAMGAGKKAAKAIDELLKGTNA
jgi:glutamate synthase (NADPH) small chain